MTRWLCIALFLLGWSLPAEAAWDLLHLEFGQDNAILDLSMPDERSACAVGAWYPGGSGSNPEPLVACTEDGGNSWRRASLDGELVIPTALQMLGGQTGYLTSFGLESFSLVSKVWRTDDAGRNWTALEWPGAPAGILSDVLFLDVDTGWVAGAAGVFLTRDGGQTWSQGHLPSLGQGRVVEAVFFLDASHGFAVGGRARVDADEFHEAEPPCCGFILESIDGGENWQLVEGELEGALHAVVFPDAGHGWAVGGGSSALILHSSDGGRNWNSQPVPSGSYGRPDDIAAVSFPSLDFGVAVGNIGGESNPSVLFYQDDGSWTMDTSYSQAFEGLGGVEALAAYSPLFAMDFPLPGRGMVAGGSALVAGYAASDFCVDLDGDGHRDEACGGDDCDDRNPFISPTAEELCNGLDENCDGIPDESFDLLRDPDHCGECGFNCQPALVCWEAQCVLDCPAELLRCGRTCVDPSSDPAHCGQCDRACEFAHASGHCIEGQCQMGACEEGWVDLDDDPESGCEHAGTDAGTPDAGLSDGGSAADEGRLSGDSAGGCSQGAGGISGLFWVFWLLVLLGGKRNYQQRKRVEDGR